MRMPESLSSLVDEGIIDEVIRPLMSGKEAQIYLVERDGQQYVAKIYKEAQNRTFKHRTDYTEGRKVRNSRDQRAMNKRSRHGRGQDEEAWRATEVDMIYRLQAAGVRVPVPYQYMDGVLIMELVVGGDGLPAPRLGDVEFTAEEAVFIYQRLLRETVRMLCAGVVHGDLSDFNVLLGVDGPVIIDFPQAIDPSMNQNARRLLLRDVENLHRFVARFAGSERRRPYAEEMWKLYESNQLQPDTELKGTYRGSQKRTDTKALLEFIGEVNEDEQRRRGATETSPIRPRRVEVIVEKNDRAGARPAGGNRRRPGAPSGGGSSQSRAQGRSGVAVQGRGNGPPRSQGGGNAGRGNARRGGPQSGQRRNPEVQGLRMAPQGIGQVYQGKQSPDATPMKLRMLPAEGAATPRTAGGPAGTAEGASAGKKRRRRRRRTGGEGTQNTGAGNQAPANRETSRREPSAPRAQKAGGSSSQGERTEARGDSAEGQRRRRRNRPGDGRPVKVKEG